MMPWKEKKSADETLKIIKEILDYNEEVQKAFALASKVDKGKSEPKPEESIAERVKLRWQKSEEKEFNNFLEQSKEEQTNIDIAWFKNEFNHKVPDKMLQILQFRISGLWSSNISIEDNFDNFSNVVMNMPKGCKKNEGIKILNIVNKIFNFISKDQKQKGNGLKILTPNQMLSKLPISLAQLNAGNNYEKLEIEIRQLLYSLYRSKKTYKATL